MSDDEIQDRFDDFYEDFFCELAKFGQLVEIHVCDNVGDHLIGNVYARYEWEEEAQRAVDALNDKWYNGRPLFAELSPVTDFREACCRQNETNECNRGGFCNFMHLRYASPSLVRQMHHELAVELRMRKEKKEYSKGSFKGWKDRVESADGAGDNDDVDAVPSWKKGKKGGDWRSGARGTDGVEELASKELRDPCAGDNRLIGLDGPQAGSEAEYRRDTRATADGGETGEKMRGWRSEE